MKLDAILNSNNLVASMSKEKRQEIYTMVDEHYKSDLESRKEWESRYCKWQDMTGQVMEAKSKPWRNAANIKYPLLTQAALQFNARVVPALMPNAQPVGAGVIGGDPDGSATHAAQTVARHMNFQLITEMDEWEEQFDSLLMAISISGTEFKKTYYDPYLRRNVSKHVSPTKLVINYYAEDDIASVRKTEVHRWNKRYIMERIASGEFVPVDWTTVSDPAPGKEEEVSVRARERLGMDEPSKVDGETPYTVLEYHGWMDMDGDGYEEPYIITVVEDAEIVLQMIPRFTADGVQRDEKNKVLKITPHESYTKFCFIPDPDGSFYGIGFGHILYPINATVNTAINQLLDAGTLNNMPGGFMSRGVSMKGGMFSMTPGKWFSVQATGDDLRKGMVPFPTTPPSDVLLSLLTYMVDSAERLSATTDIFTGEHPGQNTKASVTKAVREEGQKVFTAIYKRIRRSLKKELEKLYSLNAQILNSEEGSHTEVARSAQIFAIDPKWYTGQMNIQPSADPNVAIKEQKVEKDMTVLRLIMETGVGNLPEALKRIFTTLEVENLEAILPPEAAQQPSAIEQQQQATQQAAALEEAKIKIEFGKLQLEADKADKDTQLEKAELELKRSIETAKIKVEMLKAGNDMDKKGMEIGQKAQESLDKIAIEKDKREIENKKVTADARKTTGS